MIAKSCRIPLLFNLWYNLPYIVSINYFESTRLAVFGEDTHTRLNIKGNESVQSILGRVQYSTVQVASVLTLCSFSWKSLLLVYCTRPGQYRPQHHSVPHFCNNTYIKQQRLANLPFLTFLLRPRRNLQDLLCQHTKQASRLCLQFTYDSCVARLC